MSYESYDLDFKYEGEVGGITQVTVRGYIYIYRLRPEDGPTIEDFNLDLTLTIESSLEKLGSPTKEKTMCTMHIEHDFGDAHNFLADLFRDLDKEIILEVLKQEKHNVSTRNGIEL